MGGVLFRYSPHSSRHLHLHLYLWNHSVSIVEIAYFNSWMKLFLEYDIHQTVFIYLHTNSYLTVLLGIAMMAIAKSQTVDWLNNLVTGALTLVLASSIVFIVLCPMKPPRMIFEGCDTNSIYVETYNKAKQVFCQSPCECYLY